MPYRLFALATGFMILNACGNQELIDEVDTKCSDWISAANTCLGALNEVGGGSVLFDEAAQCDPIVEAAQTSTTEDLQAAVDLLDCQIAAYDTDCSTFDGGQAAVDAANACLAGVQ